MKMIYFNVLGASRPCKRGIMYFIKHIVEPVDVEGASYLGNRGINYHHTR